MAKFRGCKRLNFRARRVLQAKRAFLSEGFPYFTRPLRDRFWFSALEFVGALANLAAVVVANRRCASLSSAIARGSSVANENWRSNEMGSWVGGGFATSLAVYSVQGKSERERKLNLNPKT